MKLITRLGRPRCILIFLLLVMICLVLFAIIIPAFLKSAPVPGILDMQPGFSPQSAYEQIGRYGREGRMYYNYLQMVDTLFPLSYGLLLSGVMTLLLLKSFPENKRVLRLSLVPLGAALADLLENLGIFAMIRIYPSSFETVGFVTSAAGIVKFGLITGSIFIIVFCFVSFTLNKFRKPKSFR